MKILAVSDVESRAYYDFYTPGKLAEFDLIISCGDLPRAYLEFLVTMARCPLLYVHGNHDEAFDEHPPEGCVCIEDSIYVFNGVRILGLGGSHRYRPGTHQFTEREMERRVRRMWLPLRKNGGFDLLVTHAPARGVNDLIRLRIAAFPAFSRLWIAGSRAIFCMDMSTEITARLSRAKRSMVPRRFSTHLNIACWKSEWIDPNA